MRRHAKASTAGPTQRQASGLGRFFRGALATRGVPSDADGSGTPSYAPRRASAASLFLGLVALSIALLLCVASTALAAVPPTQVFTAFAAPRLNTSARINGYVNPQGETLTYSFEYSKDGGATWIALPSHENTGKATEQVVVGQELTGLNPNTTYSYRFSAENSAGPASPQGAVKTFATRSSAELADPGRGIELVSNPDNGNQNVFSIQENAAEGSSTLSADGESALWQVFSGAPGGTASSGQNFLAERTPNGWVSHNLIPPAAQQVGEANLGYQVQKTTPDFRHFVFGVGGGPLGFVSYTLVRLDRDQHQDVLGTYAEWARGYYGEISDDGTHVLIINPDNRQLEDIGGASPKLISVMPGGMPSECGLTSESFAWGLQWKPGYRMMDVKDAARVYFRVRPNGSCGSLAGLYERDRESEETTLIDPGALGHDSEFIRSTPDGRHAYFVTYSKLDPADTNSGNDVYRWDEAAGESTCLTCVVANAKVGAFGTTLISDDFSHVYFTSTEQLVPGHGTAGQSNTYALSDGTIHFVGGKGAGRLRLGEAFLSSDGNVLVFRSDQSGGTQGARALTADQLPEICLTAPFSGAPPGICTELYRYDDRDGSMECLSCRHDGQTIYRLDAGFANPSSDFRMSADGSTAAFVTLEKLLPLDVNQTADVYEWRGGTIHLVTDGVREFQEGLAAPQVRGISRDGTSILFSAAAQDMTGFEQDGLANLYVGRIGGGFEPPAPPVHCDGDSCQGPLLAPPTQQQPASSSFSGRGNAGEGQVTPRCAKGKVRRGGRCVARHPHKRHHKRASYANQGRTK